MSLSRKVTIVPALLLSLSLASCDRILSAPESPDLQRSAAPSYNVGSLSDYTLIEGQIPSGITTEASRVIGVTGGSVSLAGHTLTVPAGAVEEPAVFTLTLLPTGNIEVNLSAYAVDLSAPVKDLGGAGFKNGKTVKVTLSYAYASNVQDPNKLVILRMLKGGQVESLKSVLNPTGKSVSVELEHFSKYCLASN